MLTRDIKVITVAGGCFWGVEEYFNRLKGIVNTSVGYANGNSEEVTYKEVCTGKTGHVEAVMLFYNHAVISLEDIVNHLFRIIDPTLLNQQGNDIGTQYRTGIYTQDEEELERIKIVVDSYQKEFDKNLVVEILPLENFVKAEDYHQNYLINNPGGYCHVDFSVIKQEEMKDERKR